MNDELRQLRGEIKDIDKELLDKVKARLEVAEKIGELKKNNGEKVEDREREEELEKFYESTAEELRLDVDFVKNLFQLVIQESKKIQNK